MEIIDEQDFKTLLANERDLFIVSFYTNSCPNCSTLNMIFDDILRDKSLKVFKINAEEEYTLAKEFQLLGVPTTLFYRHGYLVEKKLGVKSKENLLKSITKFEQFTQEGAEEYSKKSKLSKILSGWLGK